MTWNVVYEKTIAGTVSQEKIDELRASVRDRMELNPNYYEGIHNIQLTSKSSNEEYAKYLFLIGEVIEEETIDLVLQEVDEI